MGAEVVVGGDLRQRQHPMGSRQQREQGAADVNKGVVGSSSQIGGRRRSAVAAMARAGATQRTPRHGGLRWHRQCPGAWQQQGGRRAQVGGK